MFNYKKFSLSIIFTTFHILQTKLSHPVQIPDIVNASIVFPISCQPRKELFEETIRIGKTPDCSQKESLLQLFNNFPMLRNSCVINKPVYVYVVTNIDKSIDNQVLKIDREYELFKHR